MRPRYSTSDRYQILTTVVVLGIVVCDRESNRHKKKKKKYNRYD